jgi:hypothetical protein
MGEAVGVVSWFRSLFLLDEADEAAEELKQQQARSRAVKNGMNDAAERLKRSREAVIEKARAIQDTIPPDDPPTGDPDAEVPFAARQLKSSTG